MFETNRLPPWGLSMLVLVVYFPVGFLLAVLRMFIGFHAFIAACVLPKTSFLRRLVLRVMCTLLGFVVVQNHLKRRDSRSQILVANYTSTMDRLAVELVFPCIMPSMWDIPSLLSGILGYEDMGAKHGRETLVLNAKKHCQESRLPLLAFPEGATTSGRVGLLKFSVWPFSLDQPVQPIVIRIVRPSFTAGISPSVIDSYWWTDLLWFLFVPYSCFHLEMLPAVERTAAESVEGFTGRVQRLIASSLNVSATSFTSADKMDLIKQLHTRTGPADGSARTELDLMVSQVLSVLPHVPANIIRQDLLLTKDVDLTISNFLDGRTTFDDASSDNMMSPTDRQTSLPSISSETVSAADSRDHPTFGHTSAGRQRSLSERKKALIDSARQRYIEKHGVASSS